MPNFCAAFGCSNNSSKAPDKSYHRFPSDPVTSAAWTTALKREGFTPSEFSRLCSDHFPSDSFTAVLDGKRYLKSGEIPSIFNTPSHLQLKATSKRKLKSSASNTATLTDAQFPTQSKLLAAEHNYAAHKRRKVGVTRVSSLNEVKAVVNRHENEHTVKFVPIRAEKSFTTPLDFEKIARRGKRFVEGIATTVIGTKTYQCKEGRDMNIKQKMKYKAKREKQLIKHSTKKRCQNTVKKNCPATLCVRRMVCYPEYKLTENINEYQRRKVLGLLNTSKDPKIEEVFEVSIPEISSHRMHPTGKQNGMHQSIDDDIKKLIHELVAQGVVLVRDLKPHLETHRKERFKGQEMPDRSNRRFWPTNRDLKNHLQAAFKKRLSNKMAENESSEQYEKHGCIVIEDNYQGYPLGMFCIPKHYEKDLSHVMMPKGLIDDRVEKMALDIKEDLNTAPLVCLCVLKGGYKFFADLVDRLKILNTITEEPLPLSVDFIRLKSYKDDKPNDEVQVVGGDALESLSGKNVLIVEDIVDTGKTMVKLLKTLEKFKLRSVKVASLLVKRTSHSCGYRPDYTGFEVPDHFVVGYALDYNEYFRDLQHICVINETGKRKYAMC